MSIPAGFEPFSEQGFMGHIAPLYRRREGMRIELGALIAAHQSNPLGAAHGGFLTALMDVTIGLNCAVALSGKEEVVATVQLNVNMVAAARAGEFVTTHATIDRITRSLSFASGRIAVGERTVMTATAIFRNPPGYEPKLA